MIFKRKEKQKINKEQEYRQSLQKLFSRDNYTVKELTEAVDSLKYNNVSSKVFLEEASRYDLSDVVMKIINQGTCHFHDNNGEITDPTEKILIELSEDYARKKVNIRDKVLEGIESPYKDINKGCSPNHYQQLCAIASIIYDNQVFETFKDKLIGKSYGIWTLWLVDPLVSTIIEKTLSDNTSMSLRQEGAEFLTSELEYKGEKHPMEPPRNMMYLGKIASAIADNGKNKAIVPVYKRFFNVIPKKINELLEVSKFYTRTWIENEICLTKDKRTFPTQDTWHQANDGNIDKVMKRIEEVELSQIYKVPSAGIYYDKRPIVCFETAQELMRIYGGL